MCMDFHGFNFSFKKLRALTCILYYEFISVHVNLLILEGDDRIYFVLLSYSMYIIL
jgi:hypothetical protein